MTKLLIVKPNVAASTRKEYLFDVWADNTVLVGKTAAPLRDGCRALLTMGVDPRTQVVMRYAGGRDGSYVSTTVAEGSDLKIAVGQGAGAKTG